MDTTLKHGPQGSGGLELETNNFICSYQWQWQCMVGQSYYFLRLPYYYNVTLLQMDGHSLTDMTMSSRL